MRDSAIARGARTLTPTPLPVGRSEERPSLDWLQEMGIRFRPNAKSARGYTAVERHSECAPFRSLRRGVFRFRLQSTEETAFFRRVSPVASSARLAGGGGRTRTYEGLASGFTVRPLCHSGHSPMSAGPSLADENAPGWPRRVAARLMLPHGSACQLEIWRSSDGATAAPLCFGEPR
jgi:hypothetical protein